MHYNFFSWEVKSKSRCSVKCGYGHKNISYKCVQRFSDSIDFTEVPDKHCKLINKPQTEERCFEKECDSPTWIYEEYGPVRR